MNHVPGNQKLVRSTNQQIILDVVRRQGPISRAALAKIVKLSVPSVSSNIEALIGRGIIREAGIEDVSTIGRPPIMLEFNRYYGYIIGIDLGGEDITVALGDLQGNIIAEKHLRISLEQKIARQLFENIIEQIRLLLEENGIDREQLKVIAAATPGIINKSTGYFDVAPRFAEWNKLNVEKMLEDNFGAKVIVMNDMNLVTIGESRFGAAIGYENVVTINVDVGIGAGLLINGKLYEGARLAAGELGYWVSRSSVDPETGQLVTTNLDTEISLHSLIQQVRKDLADGAQSELLGLCKRKLDKVDFAMFVKAVEMEDAYCLQKIREMIAALAPVIANISVFLDLELIIICGDAVQLGYTFIQPLREMVNKITPLMTTIVYSSLGSRAGISGGFSVALDYVMEQILLEG
ncbi:ROK family transcriptional regulator [Paenibacillus sp. 598K]|uniref:ROK family transcriptional regulator n=1 Tax=Paenibacillus sp. 598K TaxID=1117987 RepID=UPI00162548F3|nr:ROK family transcriptional regulator [Paenibacillus sp. 598K]